MSDIVAGFVLLITVVTILLLYVVGLIVVRRIDKEDVKKIGVCPLMDNNPEDRYLYEITVNTGRRRDAGNNFHRRECTIIVARLKINNFLYLLNIIF